MHLPFIASDDAEVLPRLAKRWRLHERAQHPAVSIDRSRRSQPCSPMTGYPYSTRGSTVTMPGQSVSSSTKPIMITR